MENELNIYKLIQDGDYDTIKKNINKINLEEEHCGTCLNYAIAKENNNIIDLLIENCNVNHRSTDGITPVFAAVLNENEEVLKKLIKKGAYTDSPIYNGLTPIYVAVIKNNINLVKILLESLPHINDFNMKCIMNYDEEEYREIIQLIKNYQNPPYKKHIYPYEHYYELGSNPTCEDDGFHGVLDVFVSSYGTRMITKNTANFPFGFGPIIGKKYDDKIKFIKFAAPLKAPSSKSIGAFLSANGNVKTFNILNDEELEETNNWKDIIDIKSTNYTIVGLDKNGKIHIVNDTKYEYYNEVLKWGNIRKICTGNNSIFAIDKDNNLFYAMSSVDKMLFGDIIDTLSKYKKVHDIEVCNNQIIIIDEEENCIPFCIFDNSIMKYLKGIKQISLAETHASFLMEDSTVLSFGLDECCECNTIKWHDIERIQATRYNTIGYAKDGEILCTENMSKGNGMMTPKWVLGFGNQITMVLNGMSTNIFNLSVK